MSTPARSLLVTLAILVALLLTAGSAWSAAAVELRVGGGESAWHADNDFRLDWDPPAIEGNAPAGTVGYRLRDEAGHVLDESRAEPGTHYIDHIHVLPQPGRYTAELWFEDAHGQPGPPTAATLRFDDARPGFAQPSAPLGWVPAKGQVVVRIEHPAGPMPISGIRGYAVSVDGAPSASPCAGTDRCSDAETDLRAGIGGDTISLGALPEGTHVVHSVAVSGAGMRSALVGSTTVRVDATPPELALRGVQQGWISHPVRLTAVAADSLSGMAPAGPNGPLTTIAADGGVSTAAPGDSVTTSISGEGTHGVVFLARDVAGNESLGEEPAAVRIDESRPTVAFARSQDGADPERLEATVIDQLSGPDPARGSIAVRVAGSRQQFAPLTTTVTPGKLVAHWDSDAFPAGAYEFQATGYDAAGNSAAAVNRANGTRMLLSSPLKQLVTVQAGFGGKLLTWHRCVDVAGGRRCHREAIERYERRPAIRTVPYGRGMLVSGRLTTTSGSPLGGLPVQVIEAFGSSAEPAQRTTTVETTADGSFSAHLAPGSSRHVEAIFAGSRVLARATGRQLRLAVLAGLRMHASTSTAAVGGAPVVFSGRLASAGASIPAGGRPIGLQFRLPHGDWSEFRTVQTDSHGRFHYPYAFSDDDSRGVRFQFRAYAPAQDGWPYEPSASRPVFVTGR